LRFMAFEDGETVDPMGLMVMHGRGWCRWHVP
jgi:hypothetical protein